jgi:hypothetical protein
MIPDEKNTSPPNFGSWQEAEDLRKWSFLQRSPQQRLDWLVQALAIAYECGALQIGPKIAQKIAKPFSTVP